MKTSQHLLVLLLAFTGTLVARAYTLVSVDTTGLIDHSAGPFYIDFQFNDGTGANDNTVNLTGFTFGGGSAVDAATHFGGASGDLTSGITLTDTEAFNEIYQQFLPGTLFSFQLSTTAVFGGDVPDIFGFAILDANLFNLATYSLGSDQLLTATLNGPTSQIEVFASLDGSVPAPRVPDTAHTLILAAGTFATLLLGRRCLCGRPAATA